MAVRRVVISVTDLLNNIYHPKDLGGGFLSATRGQEGTEGHHLVSTRRLPGYRFEVPVQFEYSHPQYLLEIRGRIDGLLETSDRLIIEEVKTTYLPLDELSPGQYPLHEAQLKLYLHFLMKQHPEITVSGNLTYLNLEDLSEKSFPLQLSPAEGETFFTTLAETYLKSLSEMENWQQLRNESLQKLEFPFKDRRPGQEQLMAAVQQAIQSERDLFIEAATGIGKTIAVLYPALKGLASAPGLQRIFFLTAKTSGKAILKKTLTALRQEGLRLRTVFIEAKERVCLNPGGSCLPEACPYTVDYYTKIEQVIPRLLATESILPELVRDWALHERICPFELSLDLAKQADLVVGDYNYVFDPGVFLRRFFLGPKHRDCLFLIDEAHNLVTRGREMYSSTLCQGELTELINLFRSNGNKIFAALSRVAGYFDCWKDEMMRESRPGIRLTDLPELMETALEQLAALLERWLRQDGADSRLDKVRDFYFQLTAFLRVIPQLNNDYAIYVKQEKAGAVLRIFCLNPGPLLQKRLEYSRTAVFFSATLSPGDYFQELLGGRADSLQLRLGSPFLQENRLFIHVPGIDTRYNARSGSAAKVAQCAADLVLSRTGNYLMFFPSYSYLQAVWPFVKEQLAGKAAVYVQFSGMSERQKSDFLRKVSAHNNTQSNLGLAVLGGTFGEGIDLPGEDLVGVIIVGPGLPQLNEEQELIRLYFDERDGRGMLYSYVIPGLIRVIQSAGRVFRTPDDHGVVMLLDDRFLHDQYQELLPPDWFRPGHPFSTPDYQEILDLFWSE